MMPGSGSAASAQQLNSPGHDVELARSRDQQHQQEHSERIHLIPKKAENGGSYQHSDQKHAHQHGAAPANGSHADTSILHLPEPIQHVAEVIHEDLEHVAHATHEYIVKHHRGITTFLVAVTRILEQTDATLLAAVYFYVGCAFNATPAQLGSITFARLIVSSFSAPIGGLLGHRLNRVKLVACTCWYWAFCTVLFAASHSTAQGMAAWAFNGIGMGIMIPNAQSLIADYYDATHRGRAFGMLLAVGAVGSLLSSIYATNIGGFTILGIQGWRFAFLTVALLSAVAGVAMWIAAKDPRCSRHTWQLDECFRHPSSSSSSSRRPAAAAAAGSSSSSTGAAAAAGLDTVNPSRDQRTQISRKAPEICKSKSAAAAAGAKAAAAAAAAAGRESESSSLLRGTVVGPRGWVGSLREFWKSDLAKEMWVVLSTPSFIVVVVQGFLGSTPWSAFAFTTLYLQLQGWTDAGASAVMAIFSAADALGSFLGGVVGDWAAARYPDHGRITACQFSVGIGVPLCLLIFQGLPMGSSTAVFALYAAIFALMGLLISWAATACNNPIFAEIVPPHLRTLVYAFDRCLEGALSALGAPMVGVTAQRVFHFSGTAATQDCTNNTGHSRVHQADLTKARALGDALTLFSTVPWTLCCLVYTLLHWTYPKDKRRGGRTGMPIEAVQFSPLPVSERTLGFSVEGGDSGVGFGESEVPVTPGLIDKIDEYISHPRVATPEVPEVELQEAGLVRRQ